MGKIPTIAIVAVALVLAIGISVACLYFLIRPEQKTLAGLQQNLASEEQVAAGRPQAEAEEAAMTQAWLVAQRQLEALRDRKSIPISMYMPVLAMTTMWWEYRDNLPRVVEKWVADQGCVIETGATMPAPSLSPPAVPASGFLQVPDQALSLTITGTMANLERLYRSLSSLPRVATIGGLRLSGQGDRLTAQVPITMFIIVEGAEAVAPPPAAPAAGGGMGGGGMGPAMGGAGGSGPAVAPSSGATSGGDEGGDKKGKEDEGGGLKLGKRGAEAVGNE
jgi:hypothetical protein